MTLNTPTLPAMHLSDFHKRKIPICAIKNVILIIGVPQIHTPNSWQAPFVGGGWFGASGVSVVQGPGQPMPAIRTKKSQDLGGRSSDAGKGAPPQVHAPEQKVCCRCNTLLVTNDLTRATAAANSTRTRLCIVASGHAHFAGLPNYKL